MDRSLSVMNRCFVVIVAKPFSLDDMLNITIALIVRIHKSIVSRLNLPSFPLVLQHMTSLLTPQLLLLLLPLPLIAAGLCLEERLHFVVLVV